MLMNSCQRKLKALTPSAFPSVSLLVFLQPPLVVSISSMNEGFPGNFKVSYAEFFRMHEETVNSYHE